MKNHTKAKHLYYTKDPEKMLQFMVVGSMHQCIDENCKSIKEFFERLIEEIIDDEPETIICILEAIYETILHENEFIAENLLSDSDEHLRDKLCGSRINVDMLFDEVFDGLMDCAKKYNGIKVVNMMVQYYLPGDGDCVN